MNYGFVPLVELATVNEVLILYADLALFQAGRARRPFAKGVLRLLRT